MTAALSVQRAVGITLVAWMIGCVGPRSEVSETIDLAQQFGSWDGAFVLYDESAATFRRYQPQRCAERLSPCSTFKIPNSLIGLETGVLTDAETMFPWDGMVRERAALNKDHTLRSALRDSVVWYYQEVAQRVGEERMRTLLAKLDYGNQDMSDGLTTFWLGGSLKVSADEQIEFLRKLADDLLPVSLRAQGIVRDILIDEQNADFVLRGKTGTQGDGAGGSNLGWYVGWVERDAQRYFFAANIKGDGATGFRHARAIALQVLRDLGVLPEVVTPR